MTLVQAGLPGPGVEDGAGVGGVAVGEHRAPQDGFQRVEILAALASVGHIVHPPEDIA